MSVAVHRMPWGNPGATPRRRKVMSTVVNVAINVLNHVDVFYHLAMDIDVPVSIPDNHRPGVVRTKTPVGIAVVAIIDVIRTVIWRIITRRYAHRGRVDAAAQTNRSRNGGDGDDKKL